MTSPRNYNNGKIYKIINKNNNENLFIGYTISNLQNILKHIKFYIKHPKYKNIEGAGINNIDIILIKNVYATNKEELKKQYYDILLDIEINKQPITPVITTQNIKETISPIIESKPLIYNNKLPIINYNKLPIRNYNKLFQAAVSNV